MNLEQLQRLCDTGKITFLEKEFAIYLLVNHSGKSRRVAARRIPYGSDVTIRKYTNALRRVGVPICTCEDGYFYATTSGEITETLHHLEYRIRGIKGAFDGLREAYIDMKSEEG